MEDVAGRHGTTLTLDDYAQVGHDLGTTQGAYAAGTASLPDQPWLSRSWLRGWVDACTPMGDAITDDALWRDSPVAFMGRLRTRAAEVWARRDDLLAVVESAPATVVHYDFWPSNVFVGDTGTVAVDWSQVGIGTVAQDLDQMTLDAVWMMIRPDTDPRQLERRVLAGYLDGLRGAGLDVADADVWRWYAAAASVRYVPLLGGQARTAADPDVVAGQERRFRRAYADIAAAKFRALERAVELGEQALT
jgi:Ser/Thr protein kinase RdoA (MazF antagonist)